MSTMEEIFEPGDRIFTTNTIGQIRVYEVQADGKLVQVEGPE